MTNCTAKHRGFTLAELMVTLAIGALVLSIGLPGFQGMVRDNQMVVQHNRFLADLTHARSEAVKRGMRVTMCTRNRAGTDCRNEPNWEAGWIIFTDPNQSGTLDPGETVLRVHEPLNGASTLRASGALITYNSQGAAVGFSETFRLCDDRGSQFAKGVVISGPGRPRRAVDSNGDGVIDNASGTSILCP